MWRQAILPLSAMAGVPALMVHAEGATNPQGDGPSIKSRKVKANQLPLYGDPPPPAVELLPEEIGSFRETVSTGRKAVWVYMDSIKETTDKVWEKYEIGKAHTMDALHYIQEDSGVLPRAGIITVAGLGGIVAGFRGGALRKAFYASVGMTTAASICYPHQAVDIVSGQWDNVRKEVKQKWRESFPGYDKKVVKIAGPTKVQSEESAAESKKTVPGVQLKDQSAKDKTATVKSISVAETKKDYGQSKAEDKDLYTTRGS